MITQEILQKLKKAYGRVGTVRLVVYGDFSGHTEVRDSASWVTVFPFENIPDLEAHLTSRAADLAVRRGSKNNEPKPPSR